VVNNNAAFTVAANKNVAVNNAGYNQGALYDLLNSFVTNWNLLMAKLETDGANSSYTPENLCTALASRGYGISANGMHQADLVAELTQIETQFKAVLTKLDADTQVTKTNYTTTVNALGTAAAINLDDTVVGSLGLSQSAIVSFLDDLVAKFNGLLAHLDTDAL
jgi:hypothetical protein